MANRVRKSAGTDMPTGSHVLARRVAIGCGLSLAGLSLIYACALAIGLWTLPSPDSPVGDPWFTLLESLILLIAPIIVALMVALQELATSDRRIFAAIAVQFSAMLAVVTMGVHAVILAVGRHPDYAGPMQSWLSFRWPSPVYALDILAWDVLFPISVLAAAGSLPGGKPFGQVQRLLIVSAILAFAGLSGVFVNDMGLRNIGIVGYALVFPVACALLAGTLLRRASSAC